MTRKPFTLRLDNATHATLAHLSEELHRPMNQLVQEALGDYLDRKSREVERQLGERLDRLRRYRQQDPGFEHAIDAFAKAEVLNDDAAEGTADTEKTVRSEMRNMLNG